MTREHYNRMPGVTAYLDAENPANRVVFSSFKTFEHAGLSSGISVKYVHTGQEIYEVEGKEYPVSAGQFLILSGHKQVGVCIHHTEEVEGICLFIDNHLFNQHQHFQRNNASHLLDNTSSNDQSEVCLTTQVFAANLSPLAQLLQGVYAQKENMTETSLENTCYQLATQLSKHNNCTSRQQGSIDALKKTTREELYRRLLQALSFIHDQLDQKLLIRDIATAACLSEYHLMRTFKQCFGLSVQQYMQRERMRRARHLLQEGQHTVSEVAMACGFADLQYFSKTFKKVHGLPPSCLREAI